MGPLNIDWNIEYTYDTLRFQLDSLSLWNTADTGSISYTKTFDKSYWDIIVSFYGETNIDGTIIPGEPGIKYTIYESDYPFIGDSLTGYYAINGNYQSSHFMSGDKITFTACYNGGTGGTLKQVGLKSIFVKGVTVVYKP